MPNQCTVCQREFKAAAGLGAHMRTHKEPSAEPTPVAKIIVDEPEMAYKELTRSGDFALAVCGDMAVLTDLSGKRLSRPMTIDEAQNVFQRMANARR